ncbi:uncharacterized protein [Anser cygnoides]|uniref:uncharacterized protein n=1 Tax=Anser cygnoides TaxID=8845 RepID=UPI0034D28F48
MVSKRCGCFLFCLSGEEVPGAPSHLACTCLEDKACFPAVWKAPPVRGAGPAELEHPWRGESPLCGVLRKGERVVSPVSVPKQGPPKVVWVILAVLLELGLRQERLKHSVRPGTSRPELVLARGVVAGLREQMEASASRAGASHRLRGAKLHSEEQHEKGRLVVSGAVEQNGQVAQGEEVPEAPSCLACAHLAEKESRFPVIQKAKGFMKSWTGKSPCHGAVREGGSSVSLVIPYLKRREDIQVFPSEGLRWHG